jgi:hypothetical protein
MRTTGAILVVFGILVLIKPELIAYIVAMICIALGTQFLLLSGILSKSKDAGGPISFGGYEIYKKRK